MLNNINLNLYKVFYVCAKCNSFKEASEKLYVTQPAVSMQIKTLEDSLGTKLFYRSNTGLSLTNEGKQLYNYIEKSYNYLVAGEKVIKQNHNMDYGTIFIGAPAHIASFYLLGYIETYRKKHPNVFFRIINGTTTELLKNLEEHSIDFVIDSSPINITNQEMTIQPLAQFDTCFITTNSNTKKNIENEKFVMPYERSSIRKNLEKELEKYNVKLNVVLEVETTDLIISSVKKDIGIGYVVKETVKNELKKKELTELKTKYDLPKLQLNLVYIEDYLTNLSKYFIKNHIKK